MRQLVPVASLIVAILFLLPATVLACSLTFSPQLIGYPANGAEDIPTDVIAIYRLPTGLALPNGPVDRVGSVSLASESDEVAVSARMSADSYVELVPASSLQPGTRYTLRVTWNYASAGVQADDSVSFVTGSGPFMGDVAAPSAELTHLRSSEFLNRCDVGTDGSCVSLPGGEVYLSQFVGSEEVRFDQGSFFTSLHDGYPYECLRIRKRAPNGQLSSPRTLCTRDGPEYDLDGIPSVSGGLLQCEEEGLTWNQGLVSARLEAHEPTLYDPDAPEAEPDPNQNDSRASGCGVASADTVPRSLVFDLLALVAIGVWRGRRKHRTR